MFARLAIIPLFGWLCLLFCHGWEGDKCHVWGILHIDMLNWQSYTLSMARDIIHGAVKNALIKDDWVITADPFRIQYEEFDLSADLSAERALSAEKGNQKNCC